MIKANLEQDMPDGSKLGCSMIPEESVNKFEDI